MDGTFDQVAPLDRLTGFNLRKGFALTLRVPLIDGRSRSNGAAPRRGFFVLGNVLYRRSFDRTNLRCDDTAQQTIH
jgi:hypothetical protein